MVRGWTSGRSLPILNFLKYSLPPMQWLRHKGGKTNHFTIIEMRGALGFPWCAIYFVQDWILDKIKWKNWPPFPQSNDKGAKEQKCAILAMVQVFHLAPPRLKLATESGSLSNAFVTIFPHMRPHCMLNNWYYYSFKIFPRFGLVETTCIIHHNQLLFTKFGKNLHHIQSMTSKVEPAAYYSTVDVKMTSKVEPAADYSTVDRKNLGTRLWFWWAEKQRAKRRNSIKNGEIFWMNNKAIIELSK